MTEGEYNSKTESLPIKAIGGKGGGSELTKPDCAMLTRAANQRWPMTPEIRAKVVEALNKALSACQSPRDVASVTKALIAIEAQAQADDHLADKNSRLDQGKPTESVQYKAFVGIDPEKV